MNPATRPTVTGPASWLPYTVPDAKRVRVLLSTDAANEVDDQFAIAHALLTPQFIVKGIIAAHFAHNGPTSMSKSFDEIHRVLHHLAGGDRVEVLEGSTVPIASESEPAPSPGASRIVAESMRDDPHPLFILVMGPLTDVASAYLIEPKIAGRITVVWIGGGAYPKGNYEFNLAGDIHAANVVFASLIELWQVPQDVYSMVRVGTAELFTRVRPWGEIGAYLVDNALAFNEARKDNKGWPRGEDWTLGDSPTITLVTNPNPHTDFFRIAPAARIAPDQTYLAQENGRPMRIYTAVNGRHILEDLFAKLQLAHEARR